LHRSTLLASMPGRARIPFPIIASLLVPGLMIWIAMAAIATAQRREVPLEYRLKAEYLLNFTRFVEWPAERNAVAHRTICVASQNPFGRVLTDTVRGERVAGRPVQVKVVRESTGCHVLFVPRSVPHEPFLRGSRDAAVLTVGEAPEFLRDGGIVNFVLEDGKVRFEIDREAADRVHLTISSRLLRLARPAGSSTGPVQWQGD
jgi:uncharacterized protein DUF4154